MEEKAKKPIWNKWWFWVIVIFVIIMIYVGSSPNNTNTQTSANNYENNNSEKNTGIENRVEENNQNLNNTNNQTSTNNSEQNTNNTQNENSGAGNIGKSHVAILDYSITKGTDNKDILLVKIKYTNNYDEAKSFDYTLSAKAYQNGIELSTPISSYGIKGLDWSEKRKEVKKGYTHEFNLGFYIENKNQNVEIEISPFVSTKYSQKVIKTLELKDN